MGSALFGISPRSFKKKQKKVFLALGFQKNVRTKVTLKVQCVKLGLINFYLDKTYC